MLRTAYYTAIFAITTAFIPIFEAGQVVVDATIPLRVRLHKPTNGAVSDTGRKLALTIALRIEEPAKESGTSYLDFVLTNSGLTRITLPISPHSKDFEPSDQTAGYGVEVLSLYVTSDKRQEAVLPGKTELFGNSSLPGTLVALEPGGSIQVRTRMQLLDRSSNVNPTTEKTLVGHAILESQSIKTQNGTTSEKTEIVGYADSTPLKDTIPAGAKL
jgi:hypothetical protein